MMKEHDASRFVKVFFMDGSFVLVAASDEGSIDVAVALHMDAGKDTLLHLTLLDGDSYVTRASQIVGWVSSTPEGRRRAVELDRLFKDEMAQNRAAVGLWDDE